MRLAIISDIHANLEALSAVLEDIDFQSVDRIACLGDVVGYGANPSECIALIRARAQHCVVGNHDFAVFDPSLRKLFSTNAQKSAQWTGRQLATEDSAWLKGLPYKLSNDNMLFVHSTPRDPQLWDYIFGHLEAQMQSNAFIERLCFVGHSHHANVQSVTPRIRDYTPTDRFIINPGSVGQPRDGNPKASYGLLDTVAGTYENRRIAYDIELAASKILAAGLPASLASRLYEGR
jgi:diadenosine tetraphosphatase ApaH/serine/threonine PP2A family protein phosphatase